MSSEPVAITLHDSSVWEYCLDRKNRHGEVKPYWRCSAHGLDGHYAEPQLKADSRGDVILTAADHRAIADVLEPPTKADPPHQMNQDHTNAFNRCQVCDKLAPKETRGQYNERYTYICKPHLQEIIASLEHVTNEENV